MKAVDDRITNDKKLCEVEFGEAFIYETPNAYFIGARVMSEIKIDTFDDELPVVNMLTGELVGIDSKKMVEPVKVELHIVD